MSGMTGASMLRTRRRDVNLKPNRRLDRKSSRGMLYENEELRLRTININAEVERGQSDIKKLKRENDQLKREILALRYEYDRLDTLLRDRRFSPEHSDDSASICSACPECASATSVDCCARVAFNDLSVVPEEGEQDGNRSGVESPCSCKECHREQLQHKNNAQPSIRITQTSPINATEKHDFINQANKDKTYPNKTDNREIDNNNINNERVVDVLVHDAPIEPQFFESISTQPMTAAPPPGFIITPHQPPRFHTGGNVEDLLGEVTASPCVQTTYIEQNSVFMCNTRKIVHKQCSCHKREPFVETRQNVEAENTEPKHYITEKNIELNYDYPRSTPIHTPTPQPENVTTTIEVASTVVFVERKIPVKPRKFDYFFRSRSAPVGDNEEPIYATVNKLPKRLRKMELANLEEEVSYKDKEPESRTEISKHDIPKTDSESQIPLNDDTSASDREKSVIPIRPDSPKAKKRKRFSLTFKKRERKRREKKEVKNAPKNGGPKNGGPILLQESDNERLLDEHEKHKLCTRHRPRNTMSSSSSGPRNRRDSYQEITTSHSEHERTNSVCSSVNSLGSACTHKSRKLSVLPQDGGSIPWCGCWGAGCV